MRKMLKYLERANYYKEIIILGGKRCRPKRKKKKMFADLDGKCFCCTFFFLTKNHSSAMGTLLSWQEACLRICRDGLKKSLFLSN